MSSPKGPDAPRAEALSMPASKKQEIKVTTADGSAAEPADHVVKASEDAATAPPPQTAATTAEPVAMEEDDAATPSIDTKPAINYAQAAKPAAAHVTQAWPRDMAQPAALGTTPGGFTTGRAPIGSKPTSRVQQRKTRGRGPHSAAAPVDLQWQPESLECVGESSDPAEGRQRQCARTHDSAAAGAAATAAAQEQDELVDDGSADAAAVEEPALVNVIAKATAAGARARQQQQRQAGAGAQQPTQWQQQQWQMRDSRISAGSSTTCNICASDSGGSSSSGSVTGPFAGGYSDEANSQLDQSRRAVAAAGLERLGIGSTASES